MVSIDVLKALNEYYAVLRKTCGTLGRNELNRLCLLPLLQDIVNGSITPYLTSKNETLVDRYIKQCYKAIITKDNGGGGGGDDPTPTPTPPSQTLYLYMGTSNSFPTENVILNSSSKFLSTESSITGPLVSGNFFWIALPKGLSFDRADNLKFAGDYMSVEDFNTLDITIENSEYTVYYTESIIPLYSQYVISIKRS